MVTATETKVSAKKVNRGFRRIHADDAITNLEGAKEQIGNLMCLTRQDSIHLMRDDIDKMILTLRNFRASL